MQYLSLKISGLYEAAIRCIGWKTSYVHLSVLSIVVLLSNSCKQKSSVEPESQKQADKVTQMVQPKPEPPQAKIVVPKDIVIGNFFQFLDTIVRQNDTLGSYPLTENLLLRANPWILDSLINTDYYIQMSFGNFVYDQKKMRVLKAGDTLLIPGPKTATALLEKMAKTWLDINIPAFELRIIEGDSMLFKVPVRVGKSKKKYLEAAGHTVDLRTRTGTGQIIRVNRYPIFIDPVSGKRFKFTKRDDHKTTLMPQIPWLEPIINGQRYGQMIHPTTNPRSLGKPTSNGCIGIGEANAWRLYFFAPIGTKVHIRFDLQEINAAGDTLNYENIYRLKRTGKSLKPISVAGFWPGKMAGICVCDTMF
jgi:L,D-transpeptidase ErfK/SrfK